MEIAVGVLIADDPARVAAQLDSPRPWRDDRGMDFHDFPTICGVLKHNGLVDESADRFYAGALALLRVKARQHPSHALAVEHNRSVCEWDWMRVGSPYFKIYPPVIPLLSGVGIEVPVDYPSLSVA